MKIIHKCVSLWSGAFPRGAVRFPVDGAFPGGAVLFPVDGRLISTYKWLTSTYQVDKYLQAPPNILASGPVRSGSPQASEPDLNEPTFFKR